MSAGTGWFDPLQLDALLLQVAVDAGITDPADQALTVGMGEDMARAAVLGETGEDHFGLAALHK